MSPLTPAHAIDALAHELRLVFPPHSHIYAVMDHQAIARRIAGGLATGGLGLDDVVSRHVYENGFRDGSNQAARRIGAGIAAIASPHRPPDDGDRYVTPGGVRTYVRPVPGEPRDFEWHVVEKVEPDPVTGHPVWITRCGQRLAHDRDLNATCGPRDYATPPDPVCASCRGG